MEQKINIDKKIFSKEDINLLTYEIAPKEKKATYIGCLIIFLIIPITPFMGNRYDLLRRHMPIRHIDYESAVIFAALFMGLIIYALYYKGIICLNKDIEEGYKYVYSTKITEKAWRGDNQFEMIITERPKNLNKKFLFNKDDCTNLTQNDYLEIHFLKRTRIVLSYQIITI